MRHIQSLNEFHDLSRENNYLLDGEEEDQLSLDTEEIAALRVASEHGIY